MSSAAGYFELLNSLNEARNTSGCTDQGWTNIPGPPYPTGIHQFPPATTEAETVSIARLEDRVVAENKYQGQVVYQEIWTNQCLTVIGHYYQFLNATATSDAHFSEKHSLTIGASYTKDFEITLGISMGVSIQGVAELGTNLSTTLRTSITLSESTTIERTFTLAPTGENREVSASWWQAKYEYLLRADSTTYSYGTVIQQQPIESRFWNNANTYIVTQYPRASASGGLS